MIHVINGAVIITPCARLQSFFFSSYTFPSAEGLTVSKKLLLAVCQKSLRVISLSLFHWTAKTARNILHKILQPRQRLG